MCLAQLGKETEQKRTKPDMGTAETMTPKKIIAERHDT